jgi:hypothetical protein
LAEVASAQASTLVRFERNGDVSTVGQPFLIRIELNCVPMAL